MRVRMARWRLGLLIEREVAVSKDIVNWAAHPVCPGAMTLFNLADSVNLHP